MPSIDINGVYMNIAVEISKLSYAEKKKVGCVIVKNSSIISMGYNGTPCGFNNVCETETEQGLITNPEVLHAETNAIAKVARSSISSENSTMYVTLSPCFECAKLIIQAGIKEIYYREDYRLSSGIELLKRAGIPCFQI
jgi:dCMP deaminase